MEGSLNMHEPEEHNIGKWHWEEKDFTEWAKKALKEKFATTIPIGEAISLELNVDTVEGEVFKYVRKNKLRQSFDLRLKMSFTYKDPGKDVIRGTVAYEPFCDDENTDQWYFDVKINERAKIDKEHAAACLQNITRDKFLPVFKSWLEAFEKEM